MISMRLIYTRVFTLVAAALLASCATFQSEVDNNHRTIPDIIEHFRANGVEIQKLTLVRRDILHCDDAIAIMIGEREIGIYKFNTAFSKQRERLEKINTDGFVYLAGLKKDAIVNGSFVLVGSADNNQRKKIVEAFKSLKNK